MSVVEYNDSFHFLGIPIDFNGVLILRLSRISVLETKCLRRIHTCLNKIRKIVVNDIHHYFDFSWLSI